MYFILQFFQLDCSMVILVDGDRINNYCLNSILYSTTLSVSRMGLDMIFNNYIISYKNYCKIPPLYIVTIYDEQVYKSYFNNQV